jgi:hypothetical protein
MSYWIEGWVETTRFHGAEREEEYSWQSAINIGALIDASDEVSELLFGLSKRCTVREVVIESLAAERGIPLNPSSELKVAIEKIQAMEKRLDPGDCGGYTHARWSEIKDFHIAPDMLKESDWKTVFNLVRQIEEDYRFSADQIRFVVWFNW